jgi:hypothetical protein
VAIIDPPTSRDPETSLNRPPQRQPEVFDDELVEYAKLDLSQVPPGPGMVMIREEYALPLISYKTTTAGSAPHLDGPIRGRMLVGVILAAVVLAVALNFVKTPVWIAIPLVTIVVLAGVVKFFLPANGADRSYSRRRTIMLRRRGKPKNR